MRLYFCKLAFNWLTENDPDAIDEINDGLAAGLDYHEVAARYCGRDAVRGLLYLLTACYIHETKDWSVLISCEACGDLREVFGSIVRECENCGDAERELLYSDVHP